MSTIAERVIPQKAALPLRWNFGNPRVLMATSRETRRWVMPRDWLISWKTPWETARIETCEEAGALGKSHAKPIGTYHYVRALPRGENCRCKAGVLPSGVETPNGNRKERDERSRRWFSAKRAEKPVSEPELSALPIDNAAGQGADLIPGKLQHAS